MKKFFYDNLPWIIIVGLLGSMLACLLILGINRTTYVNNLDKVVGRTIVGTIPPAKYKLDNIRIFNDKAIADVTLIFPIDYKASGKVTEGYCGTGDLRKAVIIITYTSPDGQENTMAGPSCIYVQDVLIFFTNDPVIEYEK